MFEKLSISQLIRYGYGGFLLAALALAIEPTSVSSYLKDAGPIVSPLALFAVGLCTYIVTRHVIGEFIYFQLMHGIHWLLNWRSRRTRSNFSSVTGYLAELGVGLGRRRTGYTSIRRLFFEAEVRQQLDIAHSEIGTLYITVTVLAAGGIYIWLKNQSAQWFLISAIIVFLAAIITDIQQHRIESFMLQHKYNREDIVRFLKQMGILQ